MKEDSKGYLTVEATITLTIFLFMMMFIMNMGQIYRAQNYVVHGLLQSGKLLSFSSYEYKQISATDALIKLNEKLKLGIFAKDRDIEGYWKTTQYDKAAHHAFSYCAGGSPEKTNETLKRYGLKDGVDSMVFNTTSSSGNLIITVEYQVELPFKLFGFENLTMHQRVKFGLWS